MPRTPPHVLFALAVVLPAVLGPVRLYAQHVPGLGLAPDRELLAARYRGEVLKNILPKLDQWQESWSTGDADRFAELYAEDARLYFGSEPVVGRHAVREYFEEINGMVSGLSISPADFYVSDRLAVLSGTYSYQVRTEGRLGERVESVFLATFVGFGDRWQIRSQMFREPFPGN